MTTTIFIVRHGESTQNLNDVMSGITDAPLSEKGKEQCLLLSRYFQDLPVDKVFSSPLQRANQSAEIIFAQKKLPIQINDSLIEFDYGNYEGYPRGDYQTSNDEIIKKWLAAPSNLTFPGGSNTQVHAQKALFGLSELVNNNKGSVIALLSHRTTIRLLVAQIIGLHLDHFRAIPCSNCSVTEVNFDGKWHLNSLNLTPSSSTNIKFSS